jgi:CheY-like chemotaxis protein
MNFPQGYRVMRITYCVCLPVISVLLAAPALRAQEAAPPKPAPIIADPLARDLVGTNPTTPVEIVRVLDTLIDLHQAQAGAGLLKKLTDAQLDDAKLAELYNHFGSGVFLKLSLAQPLNPAATQFAERVLAAGDKQARSPDRLAALIEQLSSPSEDLRVGAVAALKLGRDAAAIALWSVLADPARQAEHAHVEQALAALGTESIGLLAAVLESPDASLKARALAVLGRMSQADAELLLLSPAVAPGTPKEVAAAAQQALRARTQKIPEAADAAARLYTTARAYYDQPPPQVVDPDGKVAIWHWSTADSRPAVEHVSPAVAALDTAARWAGAARAILPGEPTIRRLYYGALAEEEVARVGWGQPIPTGPGSVHDRLMRENRAVLEDLLATSTSNHPAIGVAAATVLGQPGGVGSLEGVAGRPSALVEATLHADRRVRFAALAAIMALEAREPYAGSSHVIEALRFFISSAGRRSAVAADIRSDVARQQAALLASSGLHADVATGRRELLRIATASADYELVLIDMILAEPLGGQVLQDLRRDSRTAEVPIGLIASAEDYDRAVALARSQPATVAFFRPHEPAAMQKVVDELTMRAPASWVPALERLAQAQQALGWIAGWSPAQSAIYRLKELEPELLAAVDVPALTETVLGILGRLGTPASQRALVAVASEGSRALPVRQAAAAAFGKNVAAHGTLLTTSEISVQYDRYNVSEQQGKEVQAVLASILDAIELYAARQRPETSGGGGSRTAGP